MVKNEDEGKGVDEEGKRGRGNDEAKLQRQSFVASLSLLSASLSSRHLSGRNLRCRATEEATWQIDSILDLLNPQHHSIAASILQSKGQATKQAPRS